MYSTQRHGYGKVLIDCSLHIGGALLMLAEWMDDSGILSWNSPILIIKNTVCEMLDVIWYPLRLTYTLGVNNGKGVNLLGKPVYKMTWEEERAN